MYGSPGAFQPSGGRRGGRGSGGRSPSYRPPRNYSLISPNPYPQPQPQPISLLAVEQALATARQSLLAAGKHISSWKLSQHAALSLNADSWSSLGFKFHDVPSLRTLQSIEGKVNAFIHCFVAVQKMTTVHDLGVEICRSEGVEQFEEFGLGPLLQHPLVQHYFSVPADAKEVCKITIEDMISRLSVLLYRAKNREITIDEFLDFLVKKYEVEKKEDLGVRVQSLGLHIKFIKGNRRTEFAALKTVQEKCEPSEEHESPSDFEDVDARAKIIEPSPSCRKRGKKQDVGSATIDDMHVIGIKLAIFNNAYELKQGERPYDIGHIDPVKVEKIILSTKDVGRFMAAWKIPCQKHSVAEVLAMMLHIYFPDKTKMKKGEIRVVPDRKKTRMQTMFLSYPALGLLNVAVRSIKYGNLDSLNQNLDEHVPLSLSSTSCIQTVDAESSAKQDTLTYDEASIQRFENSVSSDDIIKQVIDYFDLEHLVPCKKELPLERQLVFRDCERWLRAQFAVKDFESLGFGTLFEFLERHTSLFPREVHYFWSGNFCKNSCLSVSMFDRQLSVLLSQAEKNLGDNNFLNGKFISALLKKQFPAISFQLFGDALAKNFLKPINSHTNLEISSVLFSSTLLANFSGENSLPLSDDISVDASRIIIESGKLAAASDYVTPNVAIQCLLKAPMLSDLQLWSHWDLVFAPSLGPFLEWLLDVGYIKELLCIVTCDGRIIRIDHSATFDDFLEVAIHGSPFKVAVKLLSLFCLYGGLNVAPLLLLRHYSRRAIDVLVKNYMDQKETDTRDIHICRNSTSQQNAFNTGDDSINLVGRLSTAHSIESSSLSEDLHHMNEAYAATSAFILDCLGHLPSEFRSFAADILVSGLQYFTKDTASIILRECKRTEQRIMLHEIGLSLGIVEWINDYQTFNSATESDLLVSSGTWGTTSEPFCSKCGIDLKKVNGTKCDLSTVLKVDINLEEDSDKFKEHKKNDMVVNEATRTGVLSEEFDHSHGNVEEATHLIQAIRREEFGLDSDLDNAENNLLKKQHARLGRALQCLSQELYSQDSHFLLELVQNADDNKYLDYVEPTLVFILQDSGIIVMNNEYGFSAENIGALCDVGNSTKKGSRAGYIGQKGIGFKSVFRVTDAPEIHSNGFHVKFDITQGQIGFVLPTVIPACDINSFKKQVISDFDQTDTTSWNTCIVLPFSQILKERKSISPIMSMFLDLHPSLLLFLHRLQCIKFKNMIDDKFVIMRKEILGDNMVRVSHGKEKMSWLVASETLQASNIRYDVETTKISVAFTLQESDNGEYKPYLDQQPVFAFLPLRKYGLKFILQGDFVLPSSREEVDGNSAWNQWLLSKFPDLFVSSEKLFSVLPCFQNNPGKAVTAYMSFVPLLGEVHGFFSHLPHLIISKLRLSNCLLLDGPNLEWVPPCRVLRSWDDQVRSFLPESQLKQHLGLGYLSKDITLADTLAKSLGIQEYGPKVLVEILSSVCRGNGTINTLGLDWISNWLNAFSTVVSVRSSEYLLSTNIVTESELISSLREIPFIPLSDGTYCSMSKGPIWLPSDTSILNSEGENIVNHFCGLYSKLRTVSPLLFSAAAGRPNGMEGNSVDNLIKILHKIGIPQLSGHDIITEHILPSISDGKYIYEEKNLLIDYLCFVMVHFQSVCTNCRVERGDILTRLRGKSIILTNHGYKCPNQEPIHFGKEFGNPVDLRKLIDDTDIRWNEVDTLYLKHPSAQSYSLGLMNWRDFFLQLGVTDFVQVLHVEKNAADVLCTGRKSLSGSGDSSKIELSANDWESPELIHLLSTFVSNNRLDKCKYTLRILDKMWDANYTTKTKGYYTFQPKDDREFFESSFIKCIHSCKWVACSINDELYHPKDLFYDCDAVRSILGAFAPYAIPKVNSKMLLEDIGFKVQVSLDDALAVTQSWRNSKRPSASISQMFNFYSFISDELAKKMENAPELRSKISIFIPLDDASRNMDVVPGIFMSPDKVYWHDPTGCVDLLKGTVHRKNSADKTGYAPCTSLAYVYPGLRDFFLNICGVHEIPLFGRYLEILHELSRCMKPSQACHKVFQVFVKWADDLKSGTVLFEEILCLKESLLKLEYTVLPTMTDKWVSLHPQYGLICWTDNEELMNQYKQFDSVCVLQFGELSYTEKEMLSGKVATFMKKIGISSLTEVIYREAIFYGRGDSTVEASLINWILPYVQRYVYNRHPDIYIQLKQVGFEKLTQLQIIAVVKLFYKNSLKGHHSISGKRIECDCLLQGNILYTTGTADSHMLFLELSRFFFNGTPELHMANFLHIIASMAEYGSTREQVESFVLNSQKVPELPAAEPLWSLPDLSTPYGTLPVDTSTLYIEQRCPKSSKSSFGKSSWPPTNWKSAPDYNFGPGRIPGPANWKNTADYNFVPDIHLERISRPAAAAKSLQLPNKPVDAINFFGNDNSKLMTEVSAEETHQPTPPLAPVALTEVSVEETHQPTPPLAPVALCSEVERAESASVADLDIKLDLTYSSTCLEMDKLCLDASENEQSYKTGRLGEMIAYKFFTEKLGLKDVKWVNRETETGLPYDLIIGGKVNQKFVEVKTTTSTHRNWFQISANEWHCAVEKGDSFSVARVILSSSTSAKLIVMKNPLKLCQQKVLHLALLMPFDTETSAPNDRVLFSEEFRIEGI